MIALVTGAGGFLGQAIVNKLLQRGDEVRGIARQAYPKLESIGVNMVKGDIAKLEDVLRAMKGCDLVFHVASKTGVWGKYQDYYHCNVLGTDNIIKACQQLKIPHLVYTSTPSVTFDGHDENGIDESTPYTRNPLNHYCATKALAESRVLQANGAQLATVALRPHLIWGPGDPHLIPRVVTRARAGRLKLVGLQDKLVDTVFIDNAAQAHLDAADHLRVGAQCAGKAYFISNDEPITMADMLNKILAAAGETPLTKRIPAPLAYVVGAILEAVYTLLNKLEEPIMTRFVAKQLSTSHWFDISAAKKDLGYHPSISIDQGIKQLSDRDFS